MRKDTDLSFVSLLQDENFLNLVKETNCVENQLDVLEKEFPGQREAISFAVKFIALNLSSQRKMNPVDMARIWENTKGYAARNKKVNLFPFILRDFYKVAALLIFLLTSSIFLYHRLTSNSFATIAANETVSDNVAVIKLSDGSTHRLASKDSKIEYSADGGAIVIKDFDQEEKFDNINTSKVKLLNQIIVPFGRRHLIALSDGTRVQLNSGSSLLFPAVFSENNREVYLKGEGYFEVSKNPNKPFIVKTDFMDIRVLGTTFNISAYEDEKIAYTVLVEGGVVVSRTKNNLDNSEKKLSPGQGCFYSSATNSSEIREVDLTEYTSWKDGLLFFKDKPLDEIVGRLEKYYNKKVQIEGKTLPTTLISGKLILTDEIEVVMQSLSKTLETTFKENDKGLFIINSLDKQQ